MGVTEKNSVVNEAGLRGGRGGRRERRVASRPMPGRVPAHHAAIGERASSASSRSRSLSEAGLPPFSKEKTEAHRSVATRPRPPAVWDLRSRAHI